MAKLLPGEEYVPKPAGPPEEDVREQRQQAWQAERRRRVRAPKLEPPTSALFQRALSAYERGEPMDWWEFARPGETIIRATEPITPVTFKIPGTTLEDVTPVSQLDYGLWAQEEMKKGLNHWWREVVETWGETQQAITEPVGWRQATALVKHGAFGVLTKGLQVLGPVAGVPNYLIERGLGAWGRGHSLFSKETGQMPSRKQLVTQRELWQTPDEWLRDEYGDDSETYERARVLARQLDRIYFSWMGDLNTYKQAMQRLMATTTNEEVEQALRQESKFLPELVYGFIFDPINIVTWMGGANLAARQSREVARLAQTPVDETLDFAAAAARTGGRWRTPRAAARKVGEVVHDRMRSYITGLSDEVDDVPRVVKSFGISDYTKSVQGQLVRRVLEDIPEERLFEGLDDAETVADAAEIVTRNLGRFARNEELARIRNTRAGQALDDMMNKFERVGRARKAILSPLFLGWSPQYWIGNWWDNMRNVVTRIGWRRIPDATIQDYMGVSRKAAETFFENEVGFAPRRLAQGFGTPLTRAEITPDIAEEAASIWRKLWSWIKPTPGPTLKAAASSEANFSALAITQSYIKRWPRNWTIGRGIPDVPEDIADALRAADRLDVLDAIQSAPVGKYNYNQIRKELDAIESLIVEGAEVEGRLYGVGFYLQQLTAEERAAIQAHPDILATVRRLGDVTDEAGRRAVIDGLQRTISEGVEEVAKQRHFADLQTVGWGHQNTQIMRTTEPVVHRWANQPLVLEMIEKEGHDFDLIRRIADTYGVDALDLCEPMDEAVFELIKRGGEPSELWRYYAETYPELTKFYSVTDEVALQLAHEESTQYGLEFLTHFDELTPARARDALFDTYRWLTPRARQALRKAVPDVEMALKTPSIPDATVYSIVQKVETWLANNPTAKVTLEDYDDLQHAMQLAKRYMWYKTGKDDWVAWANSDWRIDRLPDKIPNLYDIYKLYNIPLTSAIDKLDTRTFRDLGVDMDVPPSLWQRVMTWMDTDVRESMELSSYTTARQALMDKDYSILDYPDRTVFDVLFGLAVPYEYWHVHNIWNWGVFLADHPSILSQLSRYQSLMENQMEKDPLVPRRLQGWFPIGYQAIYNFLTDRAWTAETEAYFRPERLALPLESMPLWGVTYMPDKYEEIPRGREWILFNNMWATDPLVFDAVVVIANALLPWAEQHQPGLAEAVKRYIPSQAVEVGGAYWSGTRGLRGGSLVLEPLLQRMGITVPPEGLNPEGTIHEWLGLARVSPAETYWRYQWLANLAGTGEITTEEAANAFRKKEGRAWELAVRMAAEQSARPSFHRWAWYAPLKTYPSEERVMRGMGLIYQDAYKRYQAGDRDALREFYAVFPDYRFRQLSYRYWDVASGKTTEEAWQDWLNLNLTVNEYYQERGNLERERMKALELFVPGSPEHYRTRTYYRGKRDDLNEKYGDTLDEYFNYLADNRNQYIAWRDGPRARAMRTFLDRWFEATPEGKQQMLENLPQTVEQVAMEVRGSMEPRLFTALEVRQELCRRDEPVDAVYRELNNQSAKAWDLYYSDWFKNNYPDVQDMYATYLRLEFPENINFREGHPELDKALAVYEEWRDDVLNRTLNPTTEEFVAAIKVLHPDWEDDDFEAVRQIGKSIGPFTVSEYTYIRGSDRDMVISELWRFWTTLPERSLARKRAQEILGPRFSERFLAGDYREISDHELALWLNLLPEDWHSLVPGGRRPPFGTGPTPLTDEQYRIFAQKFSEEEFEALAPSWVPPGPETREDYRFAPTARVKDAMTEEEVRAEAQTALEDARAKLREGEPVDQIELPSPLEEQEYQQAYQLMQRAFEGETDLWRHPLVEKWFPPNSPSRRFWQFWYDCVPPGQLGNWAKDHSLVAAILDKVSRKYITEDAYSDALRFLIEELPNYDIGDPSEYAQARAEAEVYYALPTPELEQLRNVYFELSSTARRQFLQEYPQLQALFNAQNQFKAEHPIFTKYYDPDWVERQTQREAGFAGGGGFYGGQYGGTFMSGISWRQFVASAGPLVMGELMQYWAGRASLSESARKHLKLVWERSGTQMEFDEWLEYVKRLWIYYGTTDFKAPRPPQVYLPGIGRGAPRAVGRARWMIRR